MRQTKTKAKTKRAPRWIGASAPRNGTPARPRSIRVTDDTWARWEAAATACGKSITVWLHAIADGKIGSQALEQIDEERMIAARQSISDALDSDPERRALDEVSDAAIRWALGECHLIESDSLSRKDAARVAARLAPDLDLITRQRRQYGP